MTAHILDRPVWSALTTRQAPFAAGGPLARRYQRGIIPFAATGGDDDDSLRALSDLLEGDETLVVVQTGGVVLPPSAEASGTGRVVQMVAQRPIAASGDPDIVGLSDADAEDMLELATLTKPGPFTLRAAALGQFFGVKVNGRLVAMAGERMKQDGFAELSGVCTHPDFQGKGLGRRLSLFVAGRIMARGEKPFLHAYDTNQAAIDLYERIGFSIRTTLDLAVIRRRVP
ncbi:GNAT family N-acetyltransferase [Arvimicrobium flavum]|uniref:GNAT family N-acetyltransferase n=1 Tax=Arvimicrobium flavum TaxID=3393320 RepID=UPI00237B370D|nr:GNAT family N-acetyltransferase [Mesorhizobium shangrilense]